MKTLLHEMSWVEAEKYFAKNDVAILPVGSTEQHGPHNPLGTDHLIAQAIAEEAAKRTNTVCLPVIPFGVSAHHRQFWGTIFIEPKVFGDYVMQVLLSLKYYGVRKVLVVNGHGGNAAALLQAARKMREQQGMFVSVFQWWPAAGKLLPNLFDSEERGHAAAEETSMNLALHPKLVNMKAAVDEKPRKPRVESEGVIGWIFDTADYTKSGVFGVASSASTEKGKKDFEAVVEQLVKHVNTMKKAKMKDLLPKNPV
ncbi:MAG: creatininase family protein [Thermoproteota archaeon]|nr:creatininase family protein [Thermoproteota archaeon]